MKPCQALWLPGLAQGWRQSPAAHLQVETGVLHHPLRQRGDIDPPIALPREEEIVLGVLGEEPEEILQRQVVVVSDLKAGRHRGQQQGRTPSTQAGAGRREVPLSSSGHSPRCHLWRTSCHQSTRSRHQRGTPRRAHWQSAGTAEELEIRGHLPSWLVEAEGYWPCRWWHPWVSGLPQGCAGGATFLSRLTADLRGGCVGEGEELAQSHPLPTAVEGCSACARTLFQA